MTLTPAYGRDYKSKKEVLEDFDKEKDFILHTIYASGTYINKQQINEGERITFRYGKLRNVFFHTVQRTKG